MNERMRVQFKFVKVKKMGQRIGAAKFYAFNFCCA